MRLVTHKLPSKNTTMSAHFWILGSLLVQSGCMGNIKIKTSVEIEKPALAYQFLVRSMHDGWMDLSQAPSIGLHCQMDEAVVAAM